MIGGEATAPQDSAEFDPQTPPSPTPSPRPSRNMRLPKVLKNLSKRMSSRPRSGSASTSSPAPALVALPVLDKSVIDLDAPIPEAQPANRAASLEAPRQAQPGHLRGHQGEHSASGEIFTTTFVNPFRLKPRRPKTAPGTSHLAARHLDPC